MERSQLPVNQGQKGNVVAHVHGDGGASLCLAEAEKPALRDTRTGETRIVAPGERFLCTDGANYSESRDGTGGALFFPCGADGKRAKGGSAGAFDPQDGEGSHVVLGFADTVSG
ncbi:hypothetical protein [Paeniglutamicibacter psychrophenolicus]|uniref:hypothetical protein n=1 Tax=Paeniglutamicibacter psychrophenolicus TaxID=257454 RepID=UPI00278735B1|nr:hypothetical protein [Paeniglutamicibacter psychrophenolicus]MDQ0095120.1 hypothetical protein [Paeniglutamicibacter psychrophenolicus]